MSESIEKKEPGRPKGRSSSKIRNVNRLEAQTVELIQQLSTDLGDSPASMIQTAVYEYATKHLNRLKKGVTPTLDTNQSIERMEEVLHHKTRAQYIQEIESGVWGRSV